MLYQIEIASLTYYRVADVLALCMLMLFCIDLVPIITLSTLAAVPTWIKCIDQIMVQVD